MRVKSLLTESYECIKIGGILRNLSNDEMKVYKQVKKEGRLFKQDMSEYDANVATTMVSKGLLRRKKAQQDEGHGRIYYTTIGRKGHLVRKEMTEVAPPGQESEKWIRKNKKRFKDKYGKDYEKYLYGKAWNNYNGKKKVNESVERKIDYTNFVKAFNDYYNLYEELKEESRNSNNFRTDDYVDLMDKIYELQRVIEWNAETADITKQFRFMDDACDNLRSRLQDYAVEQGEFDVYTEGEYDSLKTRDNIHEMGISTFLDRYIDESNTLYFWERIKSMASEMLMKLKDENSEPEFNGNFDEIQTAQPQNTSTKDTDEIQALQKIINDITRLINNPDDRRAISYYYDDFHDIYQYNTFDTVDKLNNKFLEMLFDYVDENFANEENDFVERGDREYDSEATYDAISEESTEGLMRRYMDNSDAESFIEDLAPTEDLKNYIDKNILHQEPDEEESGDEYNE